MPERTPGRVTGRRFAPVTRSEITVVYLARHGRTELNAAGLLRGRLDVPLDEVGRAEADRLAALFRDVPLAIVVTSPLRRARDTAQRIARASHTALDVDDALVDRDYGPWAGQPKAEVDAAHGSLDAAPGVEPAAAVLRRARAALDRVATRSRGAAALVVAHDAINRTLLADLVPDLGTAGDIPQRTGCWNRLERRSGRWSAPVVDAVPGDGHQP